MAFTDTVWYVDGGDGSTTGYYALTKWAAATSYVCGNLRRQLATPAVTKERVLACYNSTGGTGQSGGAEPAWSVNSGRGFKNTDNTVSWIDVTGVAVLNGDTTNTPTWNTVKNTAVSQGQVITNVAKTLVLVCTVAGTAGNAAEPSWAAYTATGATTADNSVTWVTLLAIGSITSWGAPFARADSVTFTGPPGYGQNGNTVYCASTATFDTQSVCTQNALGTLALPIKFVSVNKSNVPPTSANIASGSVVGFGIGAGGLQHIAYHKGMNFKLPVSGTSTTGFFNSGSTGCEHVFVDCTFDASPNTNAGTTIVFNSNNNNIGCKWTLRNPTIKFGATGQTILGNGSAGVIRIIGGSIALTGSVPTKLFNPSATSLPGLVLLEGVDLTALAASSTLVGGALSHNTRYVFKDCKISATLANRTDATINAPGMVVDLIRCDNSVNYLTERYCAQGVQTTETTIVRTGGASDGAQAVSWKIVTGANCSWFSPFEALPIWYWNATTGSPVTVTVYGITGGTLPNNDEIWIDCEYLGDAGDPLGLYATSTKADIFATAAAVSTDTSTWGGSTTKFKLTATFTPQKAGPINVYVKAAKTSTTYYIDPKVI